MRLLKFFEHTHTHARTHCPSTHSNISITHTLITFTPTFIQKIKHTHSHSITHAPSHTQTSFVDHCSKEAKVLMTDSLCVKNEFHQEWEKNSNRPTKKLLFFNSARFHHCIILFSPFSSSISEKQTNQREESFLFSASLKRIYSNQMSKTNNWC